MSSRTLISVAVVGLLGFMPLSGYTLSPEAEQGKQYFPICDACHNPALHPALAPPMWGIQRRYQKITDSREEFIDLVADFAGQPTAEKARFIGAVSRLGLMPLISLPEEALRSVAAYIAEAEFAPPCEHWKHNLSRLEDSRDQAHATKDRDRLKRFCE